MSEPLRCRHVGGIVDVAPQVFSSCVDVHDDPRQNFELAKRELTELFGPGHRHDQPFSQDKRIAWCWEFVYGEITISAIVKLAPPGGDSRSWLSRQLNPVDVGPPPSECQVKIRPEWLPRIDVSGRELVERFSPFDIEVELDPRRFLKDYEYGLYRFSFTGVNVRRGIGLSADGSTLVNTARTDRVVLLPVERLLGVRLSKHRPERSADASWVSLDVQHPNATGSHHVHKAIGVDSLNSYAETLAKLLDLEVTEVTRY